MLFQETLSREYDAKYQFTLRHNLNVMAKLKTDRYTIKQDKTTSLRPLKIHDKKSDSNRNAKYYFYRSIKHKRMS